MIDRPPYDPSRVETTRTSTPKNVTGMSFYDLMEIDVGSFCPDSTDASTPATQVHMTLQLKPQPPARQAPPPLVARFHRPEILDGVIEALIEHRTYVFGRRTWSADRYPEQPK